MMRAWMVALAAAALLAVACAGDDGSDDAGTTTAAGTASAAYFSRVPLDEGDFVAIVPLGNLNPPGHTFPTDHLYWWIRREDPTAGPGSTPAEVPLYAPGDITVTRITTSGNVTAGYTDYGLDFSPQGVASFRGSFGHVFSLSAAMQAVLDGATGDCNSYSTGGSTYNYCWYDVSVPVSAGTLLGSAGGRDGQNALDFFAYDTTVVPAAYANPERYTYTDWPYAVCALDYFDAALRDDLRALLGDDVGRRRTTGPVCGEVEQDEPGTAQGNWFRKGYPDLFPEDNHLALVHHNVEPDVPLFSVGTTAGTIASGAWRYTPAGSGTVNREFADITADGEIYCFEPDVPPTADMVFLLTMPDSDTLWLEGQGTADGTCPAAPAFTTAKAVYLR